MKQKGRISPIGKNFLTGNFTEDQVPVKNINRNVYKHAHSRKQAYQAYVDYIEKDNIVLIFERLLSKGKIPPGVQTEIRSCDRYRDFFSDSQSTQQEQQSDSSEQEFSNDKIMSDSNKENDEEDMSF